MHSSREHVQVAHGPYLFLLVATVIAGVVVFTVAGAIARYPRREKPLIAAGLAGVVVGVGAAAMLFGR
jgi:hypothetical protein